MLRAYDDVDHETLLVDPVRLGHVKYVFVTMLEDCIDAAHHIAAAEGFGPPGTNAEAMQVLARHGVRPTELAEVMALAVRFRNVLVHGYDDLTPRATGQRGTSSPHLASTGTSLACLREW